MLLRERVRLLVRRHQISALARGMEVGMDAARGLKPRTTHGSVPTGLKIICAGVFARARGGITNPAERVGDGLRIVLDRPCRRLGHKCINI